MASVFTEIWKVICGRILQITDVADLHYIKITDDLRSFPDDAHPM